MLFIEEKWSGSCDSTFEAPLSRELSLEVFGVPPSAGKKPPLEFRNQCEIHTSE
jgi:hypothetical protein